MDPKTGNPISAFIRVHLWLLPPSDATRPSAESQEATDRHGDAIVCSGGTDGQCGWCNDGWGFAWEIPSRVLIEATTDPDRAAAKRAMEAVLTMETIEIAAIEAAFAGK